MRVGGVDVPESLRPEGLLLRLQWWKRAAIGFVAMYMVLGMLVWLLVLWNHEWARVIGGSITSTCTIALFYWLRNKSRLDALKMLRRHGFCSCGYNAVPAPGGGTLSCPECGRAWAAKLGRAPKANSFP